MKIVAIIPARKNSRGLPDKNIKLLCGKPLISHTIESACRCSEVNEVYLNSDSEAYLEVGEKYGAKRFLRPPEHATDEASMKSVIDHFVGELEQRGEHFDAVLVLYPVYPFRTSEDLSNIIDAFESQGGNIPLIGIKEPVTHPYLCYERKDNGQLRNVMNIDENKFYRRQQYPEYYQITHWALMLPFKSISKLNNQLICSDSFGYLVPKDKKTHVNIDELIDLQLAEFFMQNDGRT